MIESLFTSQTPVSGDNSDGAPGINPATTVVFAVNGTVFGVRFYATTTVSGTYIGSLWSVDSSDPGGGTLLQQKTLGGAPTGGTWNSIMFDTPIVVTAGVPYRVTVFSGAGRYPATLGFFTSSGLTNGNITAPQHGATVAGKTISQGTFRIDAALDYPNNSGNGTCYFVDVLFEEAAAEVTASATFGATGGMTAALARETFAGATLAATGAMTADLTRETPMAVTLAATAGLTAGLTRETSLAATLAATGGMTAALARETTLAAGLAASSGLTVDMTTESGLSATLGAAAGLTVSFVVPTPSPTDPIAAPVAAELLACFTEQLETLPEPPKYIQMRVGQETGPLIGPGVDECCSGLAWVRVAGVRPSWDSFPQTDNTWLPCGPLAYAVDLEMGIAFCMPWSDSGESFDNVDPPSTADWAQAFATQMRDQTIMRRTAACCFRPTQRRAVGEWTPLPVEGGCTGGKLTVTVSVMNPCSDC